VTELPEGRFFWIVGILEGEGTFIRPSPSAPRKPIVEVEMTDEDVVAELARAFGMKYNSRDRFADPSCRPTYRVRLRGRSAVTLMSRIYPHMSRRRQIQMIRATFDFEASDRSRRDLCANRWCLRVTDAGSRCEVCHEGE
jgi:hypothetical protein